MTDREIKLLSDYVAWVRFRRPIQQDAQVNDDTLEYVAEVIERILKTNPKPVGRPKNPDRMWACYFYATYADSKTPHLPQHSEPGGAFYIVGKRLSISAKTVESHIRKARQTLETNEGIDSWKNWLDRNVYGPKGLKAVYFGADSPESRAEQARRDAAGLVKRRYTVSEKIDPE